MHSQMGLAHFWSQGDLITHTTALILGLLSVGSWSVILTKLMTAWRASRSQERALAAFWSANSLPEALEALRRDDASGVSIAVRGPVTIQSAFSIEPVNITSTQITKSVSGEGDGSKLPPLFAPTGVEMQGKRLDHLQPYLLLARLMELVRPGENPETVDVDAGRFHESQHLLVKLQRFVGMQSALQ